MQRTEGEIGGWSGVGDDWGRGEEGDECALIKEKEDIRDVYEGDSEVKRKGGRERELKL